MLPTTFFIVALAVVILVLSYTLLIGYSIQIKSIHCSLSPFHISIANLSYRRKTSHSSIALVKIIPRLPTLRKPSICTIQVASFEYKDALLELEVEAVDIEVTIPIPAFLQQRQKKTNPALTDDSDVDADSTPASLRRNNAPAFFTVAAHNTCLRVFDSTQIPDWVSTLRRNIIVTTTNGTFLRALHSSVRVNSIQEFMTPKPDQNGEIRVSANIQDWLIYNPFTTRLYTFGTIDVQLRVFDNVYMNQPSSLAMIAQSCSWTRSSAPWTSFSWMNLVDLELSRTDVAFDHFSIWDPELMTQGGSMAPGWLDRKKSPLQTFTWDACMQTLLDLCTPGTPRKDGSPEPVK